MARIIMPLIVAFVLLLGTFAIIGLFVAGRTPAGMPVVPSGELTAASDRIAVVREDFDGAIAGTGAGGPRVRLRTRIEANHRLLDIGLARVAIRASEAERDAWRRWRREGEPVDEVLALQALAPVGRLAVPADPDGGIDLEDPLAVRLDVAGPTEATIRMGDQALRISSGRLRIDGLAAAVDVPITGPGRWTVLLDPDGSLVAVERAPADASASNSSPG